MATDAAGLSCSWASSASLMTPNRILTETKSSDIVTEASSSSWKQSFCQMQEEFNTFSNHIVMINAALIPDNDRALTRLHHCSSGKQEETLDTKTKAAMSLIRTVILTLLISSWSQNELLCCLWLALHKHWQFWHLHQEVVLCAFVLIHAELSARMGRGNYHTELPLPWASVVTILMQSFP